jgi:hypothetical protein
LDLRIYPRYSFYLASETKATFIIDTPVQNITGLPYSNGTFTQDSPSAKVPFVELSVQIRNAQTWDLLAKSAIVQVNSTGTEVEFDLKSMPANLRHPWTVNVVANSPDAIQTYYGGTEVAVLPERNGTGSVARIDNLYGGIQVKSSLTDNKWKSIFPYSFYTSWDWISSTITNSTSTKNLRTFKELGYNIIHPIPPGGTDPFDHTIFEEFLKICDELELYVMYDMRHTYQNATSVSDQLSRLQSHPSLLLYYTADEPDGTSDPLNATKLSYEHIKAVDPYHPVSLVLNCANFYFREYTSGTDIILEDVYPIAINSSFSILHHTVCNDTYGDCGCDNCKVGNAAYPAYVTDAFLDIKDRSKAMYEFQEWIGSHKKKPVWGVPQAFWDQGSYWGRYPTGDEETVMALLRINHGAKGIVAWTYPTSPALEASTSELAKLITNPEITKYILGSRPLENIQVNSNIDALIHASVWLLENSMLLIYVFSGYEQYSNEIYITLPEDFADDTKDGGPGTWKKWYGQDKESWHQYGSNSRVIAKTGASPLEVGVIEFPRR